MTGATKQVAGFEEIEALLRWHAAGTLNPEDAARVEAALTDDDALSARLVLVREELGETLAVNEALGAPSGRARDKLSALIDQEPVRKPGVASRLARHLTAFMAALSPRTLAYGAGAAALALVLQAGFLAGFVLTEQQPASHQLASAPAVTTADGGGSQILIRFNPQATIADVTRLLGEHQAVMVEGPATGGMFRVRVSSTPMPQAELAALIKQIGQNPIVGLALPAGRR